EVRTGEVTLELLNPTGRYTPGNSSSPIVNMLNPNRQVLITAEHDSEVYTLFVGYTQDYKLKAKKNEQSVEISCTDILGKLSTTEVHTDLFPSIRTGDAIREILHGTVIYKRVDPVYEDTIFGNVTQFDPF